MDSDINPAKLDRLNIQTCWNNQTMSTTSSSLSENQSRADTTTGNDEEGSSDPVPLPDPSHISHCYHDDVQVDLIMYTSEVDPPVQGWLEVYFNQIVRLAGVTEGQLNVVVLSDGRMADLHASYCGQAGSTDVLTFDLREDQDQPLMADVVVCLDRAVAESQQRGHDARDELLLYAVHGLMHLLGGDDHNEEGARKMHEREDELLTAAGVGPVYRKCDGS